MEPHVVPAAVDTAATTDLDWMEDPLWFKDAVVYQLHVKAFHDANGDGFGDFRGLINKLDYIEALGVNTIWLLPFYPSPLRDDGYDIAEYGDVHRDYGTRRDFRQFVREAHKRRLKVITELVINHTSDQHAWFQAARNAPPGSNKRDFYVWSDTDTKYSETRIIFTDTETSNWAWDPVAKQYYWHRFFSHQPDLNFDNPEVMKALMKVLYFWMDMGVDGMRLDAIPYLVEREGTNNENLPETHAVIRQIRDKLDARYNDRMFLAEANQWPEDVRDYFGDGDECHMAYHFPLMPRMFMAIAQEDRHPIVEIMAQTPDIPDNCQWAVFLRNHDELTLEMVTDRERDYMYQIYAADPRARINVGIRRRLAPLMDNDIDRIKLMNSLLLSMPGSPIIYYGDEIGMGDNIFLGDRNGVRTPMQWSPDRNAGFSKADPQSLYLPPIMDPVYGFDAVNVEAQSRDPSSLLNWTRRILAVRKTQHAFGRGKLAFLRPGNRKILAYVREYEGTAILCVANLARTAQPVELDLASFRGRVPVEMMGRTPFPPIGELPYLLTLPGYGFYWFRLATEADQPHWHEERLPPSELPVLVLYDGWASELAAAPPESRRDLATRLHAQLETEVLPRWLAAQRWFSLKGEDLNRIEVTRMEEWNTGEGHWYLALVEARPEGRQAQTWFLPLAIVWEDDGDDERQRAALPLALSKVRLRNRVGWIFDAYADPAFCRALVRAVGADEAIPFGPDRLESTASVRFAALAGTAPIVATRLLTAGTSNTTVLLEDRLFMKAYRRVQTGINPEVEMGRHLTDRTDFEHSVPVAGSIALVGADGSSAALAMLQGYVSNQGDGWSFTLDYLERYLDNARAATVEAELLDAEAAHQPYLLAIDRLGRRTGELHASLSAPSDDPDFAPEPVSAADLTAWGELVTAEGEQTLAALEAARPQLDERLEELVAEVLGRRRGLAARIRRLLPKKLDAARIRCHGDYHLGQVLVAEHDFLIIDFEGEPARSLAERRAKGPAQRDIAGMLRSLSYAQAVALAQATADRPADRPRLQRLAMRWEQLAAASFLAGYHQGVGDATCCPRRIEHGHKLVALFTLQKAFYELRYELDNRPDWVDVPLQGLRVLLAGESGPPVPRTDNARTSPAQPSAPGPKPSSESLTP